MRSFPFPYPFTMNFYTQELKLNLLPPDKLYCDFNHWSSLFTQDMSILWEKGHCVPLKNLPSEVSDMIFSLFIISLIRLQDFEQKEFKRDWT